MSRSAGDGRYEVMLRLTFATAPGACSIITRLPVPEAGRKRREAGSDTAIHSGACLSLKSAHPFTLSVLVGRGSRAGWERWSVIECTSARTRHRWPSLLACPGPGSDNSAMHVHAQAVTASGSTQTTDKFGHATPCHFHSNALNWHYGLLQSHLLPEVRPLHQPSRYPRFFWAVECSTDAINTPQWRYKHSVMAFQHLCSLGLMHCWRLLSRYPEQAVDVLR
jgi:hypothetical protein